MASTNAEKNINVLFRDFKKNKTKEKCREILEFIEGENQIEGFFEFFQNHYYGDTEYILCSSVPFFDKTKILKLVLLNMNKYPVAKHAIIFFLASHTNFSADSISNSKFLVEEHYLLNFRKLRDIRHSIAHPYNRLLYKRLNLDEQEIQALLGLDI